MVATTPKSQSAKGQRKGIALANSTAGHSKWGGIVPTNWSAARIMSGLAAYVVACGALYLISFSWFQGSAVEAARAEATLYQRSLRGALERFQHLPPMLARDPFVIDAAAGGDPAILNRRLADFAQNATLDALYLMDRTGLSVAASNFDAPGIFVGQNYGFRPYFRDALTSGAGEFFAIWATTVQTGYFVAALGVDPADKARVSGVVALKLDLRDVSTGWS